MLKTIAYIGYGFVGKACHHAFKHNCEAIIIDPKYSETTIQELEIFRPRLTFVAVSAPTQEDRTIDTSAIYDVFRQLAEIKYDGLVVLKSTLTPDIVDDLYQKFGQSKIMKKSGPLRYIYSPEFLTERNWEEDVLSPDQIILGGEFLDCKELEGYYRNHSHVRHPRFHICSYKEASLAKYAINTYLASKVVFMNQLYTLYADMDEGKTPHPEMWNHFIEMLVSDIRFGISHNDVPGPDGKYGYGGSCFPKDVKALIGYDKKERLSILREVELSNTRIRLTGPGKSK